MKVFVYVFNTGQVDAPAMKKKKKSISAYLPWHPESPSFEVLNNLQNIWVEYFPCLSIDPIHTDAKIYIVPVRCEFEDV